MKNNGILRLSVTLAAVLIVCSCAKQRLEVTYNSQEDKIDKYISSEINKDTTLTAVRNKGSNRLIRVEGKGEGLSSTGLVAFYYAGYTFNGNIGNNYLFVTNHEQTAKQARWEVTDPDFNILELDMSDTTLLEGLRNGLVGVKGGEECEILFSGKYAFGNHTFGIIPANSALAFKIWVISISND